MSIFHPVVEWQSMQFTVKLTPCGDFWANRLTESINANINDDSFRI